MSGDLILVLNCGSSNIKFALFDPYAEALTRKPSWNGKVQGIGGPTYRRGGAPRSAWRTTLFCADPGYC